MFVYVYNTILLFLLHFFTVYIFKLYKLHMCVQLNRKKNHFSNLPFSLSFVLFSSIVLASLLSILLLGVNTGYCTCSSIWINGLLLKLISTSNNTCFNSFHLNTVLPNDLYYEFLVNPINLLNKTPHHWVNNMLNFHVMFFFAKYPCNSAFLIICFNHLAVD